LSRVYLGLGSNVGDRFENIRAAVGRLDAHDRIQVTRRSWVYETEAMDDAAGQRDFYNAVAEVETDLEPRELLAACKLIERRLGREPSGQRHAPRPIDIDLLMFGDLSMDQEDLVIPHPGIAHRAFVQVPLRELGVALPGPLAEGQRVVPVAALTE
jgi:2-amino-4-hydroxy-6-hydroxymethyldihydropteridine diphosphokinase